MSKKLFLTCNYGYNIPDVDKAIERYNKVIKKLKTNIDELNDELRKKEKELNDVYIKMKELTLQLSMMEVPEMSVSQEYMIMDEFKKRKENKEDINKEIKETNIKETIKDKENNEDEDEDEGSDNINIFKIIE